VPAAGAPDGPQVALFAQGRSWLWRSAQKRDGVALLKPRVVVEEHDGCPAPSSTVGTFDGVHRGHRAVLVEITRRRGRSS